MEKLIDINYVKIDGRYLTRVQYTNSIVWYERYVAMSQIPSMDTAEIEATNDLEMMFKNL